MIVEEGREVVEIMGLPPEPASMEEGYLQLVEEGVIVPPTGPRGELAPIVDDQQNGVARALGFRIL